MKTLITACLLALTLAACVTQPANQQPTPTGQVPDARIYIKSMMLQSSGTAEVRFSRASTFLFGNSPLELAINDVVLAQIQSGEHINIWLQPGKSYTFSIKPVHNLNSPAYPQTKQLTMELKNPGTYKVRIGANAEGAILQQEN